MNDVDTMHERLERSLDRLLPARLPGMLPHQRWFGSKSRTIAGVELADLAWLPLEGPPAALVVVEVRFARGGPERYAIPLACLDDAPGAAEIGRLDDGAGARVVEASAQEPVLRALLALLAAPDAQPTARGGAFVAGDLDPAAARGLAPAALADTTVRPLGAEQSNTSVRVGGAWVFKLFRRLEGGENPELELGRFLHERTSFRAFPALRGSLTWRPASGPASTLGVLQDLVENEGDGWSWTLARLGEVLGGRAAPEPLANEMLVLGGVTADFHAALASDPLHPDFAPIPATAADVAGWRAGLLARAGHALELIEERLSTLPPESAALARALVRDRQGVVRAATPPDPVGDAGFERIRIHGDFHLGQTLRAGDGFVLMDFEGEPARPLAERRAPTAALRDVAGMLRSFDYAIETVRAGRTGFGGPPPALREAFLGGYRARAAAHPAGFLPSDPAAFAAWSDFFELDKAIYEIEYELNHRPGWLRIPLKGLARLLERRGSGGSAA